MSTEELTELVNRKLALLEHPIKIDPPQELPQESIIERSTSSPFQIVVPPTPETPPPVNLNQDFHDLSKAAQELVASIVKLAGGET